MLSRRSLLGLLPVYKSAHGRNVIMAYYEAVLGNWSIPVERLEVLTRFGPAHILASGPVTASPLLLFHGLGDTALLWMPLFGALSQSHRLYAPDIIGQPGKSSPVRLSYTGPAYVEWLLDILEALSLDSTDAIGPSLGGYLAMRLALAVPQRLRRLALLSPAGITPPRLSAFIRLLPVGMFRSRRTCRWFMERDGATVTDQAVEWAYLMSSHYIPAPPPPVLSPGALSQITAPVSLLAGEHDLFFSAHAILRRARQCLPNLVSADIVTGAGHNLVRERTDLVQTFALSTFKR